MEDPSEILCISTSWNKDPQGSTTCKLISDFCEKTIKKGPDEFSAIYCTVLDVELSQEQQEDANYFEVTLIPATRPKWSHPAEDPPTITWLLNYYNYYPGLANLKDITHVVSLFAKTNNAASAIHERLFDHAQLHLQSYKPAALFVYDVWNSDALGLTGYHRTLIQDFCERKSEAGEPVKAYSTVINIKISDDQKRDAEKCGVTLIPAQIKDKVLVKDERPALDWLLYHETYYPDLKDLEDVQYVVGYAPKTGQAAAKIQVNVFPHAKLVLINHACPEPNCLQAKDPEMFKEKMQQMASKADLVFSIGRVIYEYFENAYRGEIDDKDLSEIPHALILPQPVACFLNRKGPVLKETTKHTILTCGQLDTQEAIEKCEPIATSVGTAAELLKKSHSHIKPPLWKIQGVSEEAAQTAVHFLTDKLQSSLINPVSRSGHSVKLLLNSLLTSHVCLPASCYKDYSFYGLEAIALGLPTSVNEDSHLAQLIEEYFKDYAKDCIVETTLSDATLEHLTHMGYAFSRAKMLKEKIGKSEALSTSFGRFTSLLTVPEKQQSGGNGNVQQLPNNEQDSLPVQIRLDESVHDQHVRGPQVSEEQKEEGLNKLKAALKRKVEEVVDDEDKCQEVKKMCMKILDGVDFTSLKPGCLEILIRFLTLYNLYKLKQTCRSGSLARAFEPLLITDEMRKIATEVGVQLKLKATYDGEQFKEVELFFINRDGGGIKPMKICDDVMADDNVEDSAGESCFLQEEETGNIFEGLKQKIFMLLELDPTTEIQLSSETNVRTLLEPDHCVRWKGQLGVLLQMVLTMTARIQHILSSRLEILSLLGVQRYLWTDVQQENLTFPDLVEQLNQHGTLTPPITAFNELPTLQARSLLPFKQSKIKFAHPGIRSSSLSNSIVKSLQGQLDETEAKYQALSIEKAVLQHQFEEAKENISLLKKENSMYMQRTNKAEREFSIKLTKLKVELQEKDHEIIDLRRKLLQLELQLKGKVVLLVSSKWNNDVDRLAIVNKILAFTLARKGAEVYSTSLEVSDKEFTNHEEGGASVSVIHPLKRIVSTLGNSEPTIDWLSTLHNSVFPQLAKSLKGKVDVVVGHLVLGEDKALAEACIRMRESVAPEAKIILFNHEIPEEVGEPNFETKAVQYARQADVIFSIGDRVHEHFKLKYNVLSDKLHFRYYPGLMELFTRMKLKPPPEGKQQILTICNVKTQDDFQRYEVIAKAMGKVADQYDSFHEKRIPVWNLYGVKNDIGESFRQYLQKTAKARKLVINLASSFSVQDMETWMKQSILLVAPEKKDPFNFPAYFALQAGFPVLVPSCSGIADFLDNLFPENDYKFLSCVDVGVHSGSVKEDSKKWADEIIQKLQRREGAFRTAADLKKDLIKKLEDSQEEFIRQSIGVSEGSHETDEPSKAMAYSYSSDSQLKASPVPGDVTSDGDRGTSTSTLSQSFGSKRKQLASEVESPPPKFAAKSGIEHEPGKQVADSHWQSTILDSFESDAPSKSVHRAPLKSHVWATQMAQLKKESNLLQLKTFKIGKTKNYIIAYGQDGTRVYLGFDSSRDLEVAVKRMYYNEEEMSAKNIESKMNQYESIKSSPNIVKRYDALVDESEEYIYVIMELCEGTVSEHLAKLVEENSLQNKAKQLVMDMLNGLQCLHREGIVHGDLKPQNILIGVDGKAKFSDFGISRQVDRIKTRKTFKTKADAGTECWQAPEAFESTAEGLVDYNMQSDIHVAGMLVYFILTGGHHPFGKLTSQQESLVTQQNVCDGKYDLSRLDCETTKHLIEWMIRIERKERPSIDQVLRHPFVWEEQKRLDFLQTVAAMETRKQLDPSDDTLKNLNKAAEEINCQDWVNAVKDTQVLSQHPKLLPKIYDVLLQGQKTLEIDRDWTRDESLKPFF